MKKITLLLLTLFFSFASYSQLGGTGTEGFESTTGPDAAPSTNWTLGTGNWYVFDNGVGQNVRWDINSQTAVPSLVYQGANAAYCNRENINAGNTSEDYLATPLITIPANGQLKFFTRSFQLGNQGTLYQVKIALFNPTDPNSYILVQQWTENELTTTYNIYEEKTVNLTDYAGFQVHIAFVMVNTQVGTSLGDRWLIDNVSVVEQCFPPTTLAATNIGLTSATLSWANPSGSTSWEIEIVPVAASPAGTGLVFTNATPTYTATATQQAGVPLTAATTYKYYVRSICANTSSAWAGPFNFTTSSPGLSCNAPIQVTSLPYSTTNNTANFSDNPAIEGSPGTSCGITGNYLNGNDVVYAYTATANGTVSVTMTPTGNNSGIFAYSSCANVGVTCLAGAAGTTATVRTFNLSVTAGQTYYLVISSLSTTQTVGYTLVLQAVNCAPPTALTATSVTQTGANLGWAPGAATSWEVEVQAGAGTIPAGAGIQTNNNTNYPTPNPLLPNTNYVYYVRADCNDGGNFSAWAGPFPFRTLCAPFDVPFQEGFNSTSPTEACWTVLNLNVDTDVWDMNYVTNPFEGNQSAMLFTDFNAGNNDDWLISPQINVTGNQRLKFHYRVQSATEPNDFRVMLSQNGPVPAQFTTTLLPLTSYNNVTYMQAIVNLPATISGSINIGWHVPPGGLDGWRVYIDNVIIEDIPTCPEPSALTSTAILSTSATIGWTNGNTETQWQVLALTCGSPAPTATSTGFVVANSNPFPLTGLMANTCYDVYVRSVCAGNDLSPWTGPNTFTTQVAPPVCGGQFVDAGGPTASYPANSNSTVTICPPAGELVTVIFTEFNTETNWDALYVFDGNSTTAPQIASTNGAGNVPGGLAGGFWGTTIPGPFVSSVPGGCLTFNFRSDGSVNNAGWVANITCAPAPTCTKPILVTATLVATTSAQINWNQLPNPDTTVPTVWEVLVLPCGDPAPTATTVGGISTTNNPYSLSGLTANTCYDVYARAVCSASDSSEWSVKATFTTQCVAFSIPFQEGFNSDSTSEACWTVLNLNGDTDLWNMNYAVNPYEGDQSAMMFTDFNNGNNNDWLISPQITGLNGNQRLRYRYRVQSATEPNDFRVVVSTTGIDPASFTNEIVPLATYNNITYLENTVNLTNVTGTINIGWHVPAGGLDGWRLYIDNVVIENIPNCPEPSVLTTSNITSTSALLGWTEINPTVTQWEVLVVPFGTTPPISTDTGVVVSTNPALFTGLNPATRYTYYVRSICPVGGTSSWSNGFSFTTLIINDDCGGAIFAPVNSSAICQQVTPGTLTGATATLPAPVAPCVGTADDDVWFQFIATNPFLTVSLQNIVGSVTNLNFGVYFGTCGTLTQVFCSAANTTSGVVNGLTIGQTYFVRVYSNSSVAQTVNFNLCITTPASCITGQTACQDLNYQNTTGITSQGTIGCLSSSPNPTYYTIQVQTSGPINLLLTQSTFPTVNGVPGTPNLDVDYAAWGPFTNQAAACVAIGNPPTLAPGIGVPVTITTGCSFSAAPTETLNIANAVAGQYYVILITNFSNQPGFISLTQSNSSATGAGSYQCCPDAFFTYTPVSYCKVAGASNPVATINTGSLPGVFSVSPTSPAGLVIANTATGEIDLAASAPGNYLILNTVAATANCEQKQRSYSISIVQPLSATIAYDAASYCNSLTTLQTVTQTGTTGGVYSASPNGGLFLNVATGEINPSLSSPGVYTVTYSIPGSTVCTLANPSTTVEILALPNIPQLASVTVCNSYTLTPLTVGNYYSQPGGLGTPLDTAAPLTTTQTVYAYASSPNGCTNEKSFTVTINSVPTPTVTTTISSCASATGTITVTSPVSQTGATPANLFISEVTDSNAGSLTYVELFNGTGAAVNLANYKLKVYNNGGTTTSCDLSLTGTIANNTTRVIAVGSTVNQGGVVPNQVFAGCGGVNIDDNIRLTTATNVEIDLWGRTDGMVFTPAGQPGYTYRRLASAPKPSLTWNPADWTAIDPEDYTNVGSYTLATSNYEYNLDGGTFQTTTLFSNVAPGSHTIIVKDLVTGCFSAPLTVEIDAVGAIPSVTTISYASPFCQNDANPLPDTTATGFTPNGTYAEVATVSTGLVINATTGLIDLMMSTVGSHTVSYTVPFDPITCQQFSQSTFVVEINPVIIAEVDFSYATPVCQGATVNPMPITVSGFTTGGAYSYVGTGLDLNVQTGEINLENSIAGTYQVIYTSPIGLCQAAVVSMEKEIVINPGITPVVEFSYDPQVVCQLNTTTLTPTYGQDFFSLTNSGFSVQPATGLIIDDNTGEIDVTNSTPGDYTVTYTVAEDASICQVAGQWETQVSIVLSITPTFDFGLTETACQNENLVTPLPMISENGISGTWSPAAADYNVVGTTVYSFTPATSTGPMPTNLVVNGDFSAGNTGFTSDYQFVASAGTGGIQKAYGIVTAANQWFQFFPACVGPTPTSGNIMVVDGSTSNGGNDIVWSQTVPVQPNQNYTFSYQLQTIATPNQANIEATINGVSVGSTIAPSTNCEWTLVTYNWNSGTSTTAQLAIYDRVLTANGNDFSLDDISFMQTTSNSCAVPTTFTLTINPSIVTTFDAVAPICAGGVLNALPTSSLEGVAGTWSPALDNTQTTEYTFTPDDPTTCATAATLTIVVTPNVTPTFTAITICSGDVLNVPTTSLEGVTGTWPTIDNTTSGAYTFTPTAGQCALTGSITITVNQPVMATFAPIAPFCSGATAPSFPTTSLEGFTGTWSATTISNTQSATYTFTPTAGQCAIAGTINVVVTPNTLSTFNDQTICSGATINFPATSIEGSTGTWSPSTINTTQSGSYTFTPTTGQCVLNGVWNVNVIPTFQVEALGECEASSFVLTANPVNSSFDPETATYEWFSSNNIFIDDTRTIVATSLGSYTVNVTVNGCTSTSMFNVEDITCVIQKGISANGDGKNDNFELTGYDVKKLQIFNRYGLKVYTKANYTNEWFGQSDNGDELPDATYYYVIERNNGEVKTGWIYINRAQ